MSEIKGNGEPQVSGIGRVRTFLKSLLSKNRETFQPVLTGVNPSVPEVENNQGGLRLIEGLNAAIMSLVVYAAPEQKVLSHGMRFRGYYSPGNDEFKFGSSRQTAEDDIDVSLDLGVPLEAMTEASGKGEELPPALIIDINGGGADVQYLETLRQRAIEHNTSQIKTYLENGGTQSVLYIVAWYLWT